MFPMQTKTHSFFILSWLTILPDLPQHGFFNFSRITPKFSLLLARAASSPEPACASLRAARAHVPFSSTQMQLTLVHKAMISLISLHPVLQQNQGLYRWKFSSLLVLIHITMMDAASSLCSARAKLPEWLRGLFCFAQEVRCLVYIQHPKQTKLVLRCVVH